MMAWALAQPAQQNAASPGPRTDLAAMRAELLRGGARHAGAANRAASVIAGTSAGSRA